MIRRILLYCFLTFTAYESVAQQQTIYSQYLNNVLAINPAYAGHNRMLSAIAMVRFQNLGLEGAPNTQTFSMHTPLFHERVGVGIQMIREQIGISDQTGFYASYSYRITAGSMNISFGLQGGANFYKSNYTNLDLFQQGDQSFEEDVRSVSPNFGAGVYMYNDRIFAGVSMPQMLEFEQEINQITQYRPLMIMGGYLFDLNESIKLKPGVLAKFADERPVQVDINATLIFRDVLWTGLSYRPNNSAVLIVQAHVTDQLVFGYSYDFVYNGLQTVSGGSHEFLLQYLFKFSKKNVVSPRYF